METNRIFNKNINELTLDNSNYRKVLYTVPGSIQLVVMSLQKGDKIPREIHPHISQFIRVEEGSILLVIEYPDETKEYTLKDDSAVIIPPGLYHTVKALTNTKLYTIYTPPEHPSNLIH